MLLPDNIYDRIDEIVEHAYTGFVYQLLGDEFLTKDQQTSAEAMGLLVGGRPLLELIYLLVKQRAEGRYQRDKTLNELLHDIFATGILSGLPDTARATLDNAAQALDQIVERSKSEVKTAIKYQITSFNKEEQNQARIAPIVAPLARLERDQSQSELLVAAIGIALVSAQKTFHRDFTGELTTLVNQAAIDAAAETYGSGNLDDVYCIKRVVLDSKTSEHCKRYYLNADGTPTVYKLSELVANGSNAGRPKSQWLPTCSADHPRCRSQLIVLGPNPEFSKLT